MSTSAMRLHFDEKCHVYTLDGQKVPSVTTILKPLGMYNGIPKKILEAAALRGTNVHLACELDDEGALDEESLDPEYVPYVCAWRKFREDFQPDFIGTEQRVFNEKLRYAGTYDRLAIIDLRIILIDIKTTKANMPSLPAQLSAYAHCLPALPFECWGVQLFNNGNYVVHRHKPTDGWPVFLSLLNLRQFSYQHGLKNSFTL